MLGLPLGEVFLVPWTEEWEVEFLKEKQLIEKQIGEYIFAIHHIGSTSIPYLSAKPIIDIAIELKNFENGVKCIARLKHLKYRYRKDVLPERYYFNKGEPRTHQIHMYEKGNKYLIEQLCFRNYLINNKTARIEYEKLKRQLSKANPNNKHKYADDKTDFVKSIMDKIINKDDYV
ncbi:GrpB family protein [Bacillus proteolyticus]|uniref:GrpB family protein n=1 Tax=Bacillus proteolyticus TaxID=2026192 RepID=UPI002E1C840D|nr:GrpB family protein [Bacillus proteolyticus]